MFCTKCGSTLSENGVCPVCDVPVSDPINPELVFDQPPATSDPGKGLGITSMVLGIISVLSCTIFSCVAGTGVGGPLGIVGLILGVLGKKKSNAAGFSNGMATAGNITSIISIVLFALSIISLIVAIILGFGPYILAIFLSFISILFTGVSTDYNY
jgi:hypothetical protein